MHSLPTDFTSIIPHIKTIDNSGITSVVNFIHVIRLTLFCLNINVTIYVYIRLSFYSRKSPLVNKLAVSHLPLLSLVIAFDPTDEKNWDLLTPCPIC